jgi:hypothetical protein
MKTYYICDEDHYGQRTGTYRTIELSDEQITLDRFGLKRYKGQFLYETLSSVLRACQD